MKKRKGPAPDIEKDIRILRYRHKGFTFRAISEKMKLDLRVVYRRYKRVVGLGITRV